MVGPRCGGAGGAPSGVGPGGNGSYPGGNGADRSGSDDAGPRRTTVHLEMLRLLYAHGAWANGRVLDAAERLAPEQARSPVLAGLASVHDTLAHVVGAQALWLARWRGTSPPAMPDPAAFPDLSAIRTRWAEIE